MVTLPPSVPAVSSRSTSGMATLAVSDLMTSRLRSAADFTLSAILLPLEGILPPAFSSELR